MADILIKDLHLPRDWEMLSINIDRDGKVTRSLDLKCEQIAEAVIIPPHGRLKDTDAMEQLMSNIVHGDIRSYPYSDTLWDMAFRWIDNQPTVIEASKDGEDNES